MTPPRKKPENCWEFWDCPSKLRDPCIVYKTGSGKRCWLLMNERSGAVCKASYKSCEECPWYKDNK